MTRTELAALNNAVWCDTVCRAHGAVGEFVGEVWRNPGKSPPFYPNLVTLRATGPDVVLEPLRQLMALLPGAGWGVKDSFCTLALDTLDFERVVDASWIWREPAPPRMTSPASEWCWTNIDTPMRLAQWEARWRGDAPAAADAPRSPQFPATLLADPAVCFVAAHRGAALVAGGILNRSEGVLGVSNVFAMAGLDEVAWAGLVAHASSVFPCVPLVGWERGPGLDAAAAGGFEPIGPLAVWLRR